MKDDNEHWIIVLFRNKIIKIIVIAILLLLLISILIGLFSNKHIKIGPIEFNSADTIAKTVFIKQDSIVPEIKNPIPIKDVKQPLSKSIKRNGKLIKNESKFLGNDNHVINGNNNTVGVNGDILTGIKQRHLTPEIWDRIVEKLPENKTNWIYLYTPPGDKEAKILSDEIKQKLFEIGYNHFINSMGEMMFSDTVIVTVQNNSLSVGISKAKNVE